VAKNRAQLIKAFFVTIHMVTPAVPLKEKADTNRMVTGAERSD
jgi:hypothetical protein